MAIHCRRLDGRDRDAPPTLPEIPFSVVQTLHLMLPTTKPASVLEPDEQADPGNPIAGDRGCGAESVDGGKIVVKEHTVTAKDRGQPVEVVCGVVGGYFRCPRGVG